MTKHRRNLGVSTVAVLRAIAEGSRYGLDIMERTELPSGTVYPCLARLERWEMIRGRWESDRVAAREARPRRRYYRITRGGEEALAQAAWRLSRLTGGLLPRGAAPARGRRG